MSMHSLEFTFYGETPPKFGSVLRVSVGDFAQDMRVILIAQSVDKDEYTVGLEAVNKCATGQTAKHKAT